MLVRIQKKGNKVWSCPFLFLVEGVFPWYFILDPIFGSIHFFIGLMNNSTLPNFYFYHVWVFFSIHEFKSKRVYLA